MKKIVIIDHEPLTVRRRQIFYIDELRSAGFEVEFWDCSQYFHPGMCIADSLEADYLRKFDSLDGLKDALRSAKIDQTIFIVEVFELWVNRHFFALLHEYNVKAIRLWLYSTVILGNDRLRDRLTLYRLFKSVKARALNLAMQIYCKCKCIVPYSELITTDRNPSAVAVLNHPDWELYKLALEDDVVVEQEPYIVFLDEYFPLHPDYRYLLGVSYDELTVSYQRDMNDFFDRVEQQTSMKVIVAAHPKAEYENDTFKNREIKKGQTSQLVKNAQGVLLHCSSSVSYPVMFDKPMMMLTSDQIETVRHSKDYLKNLARLLGLPVYNISKDVDKPIEMVHILDDRRNYFINTFLTTPETIKRTNSEILIEYFSKL